MNAPHHFFASFGMGFKTAPTREKAIYGLIEGFRSDFKPMVAAAHKEGRPGAYIWSCRVDSPIDTKYQIEWFAPTGVAKSKAEEHYVTYVTGKAIAYYTEVEDKA